MMYLLWLLDVVKWLVVMVSGPVVYVVFKRNMTSMSEDNRGYGKFTNKLVDSIWGNSVDGLSGDAPYRDTEANKWLRKFWPSFWWSCIRNPANNYTRNALEEFVIADIQKTKSLTTVTDDEGVKYFFLYTPHWPVMFKFGYKMWPDNPDLQIGKTLHPKLAFSIQRGKRNV